MSFSEAEAIILPQGENLATLTTPGCSAKSITKLTLFSSS